MADAMGLIESNRARGKSVMPAVAMALIGLEIERKPLQATLKTLERLQVRYRCPVLGLPWCRVIYVAPLER